MALACNVDWRGRLVRAGWGVASLVAGLYLLPRAPESPLWLALVAILFGCAVWGIVLGGIRGWCVARAIGIKTPI